MKKKGDNPVFSTGYPDADAWIAEQYRKINKVTIASIRNRPSDGIPVGNNTKYGYHYIDNNKHVLSEDPYEQKIISEINRYIKEGIKWDEIARRLNNDGYRNRIGNRWSYDMVKKLACDEEVFIAYMEETDEAEETNEIPIAGTRQGNKYRRGSTYTPLGYSVNNIGELEEDPYEQQLYESIRMLASYGLSWAKIAEHLNDAGYCTRRGHAFTRSTLRHIANSNGIYLGNKKKVIEVLFVYIY